MRLVFLDIDGVLNSDAWFRLSAPRSWGLDHLDPEAVTRLDRLTSATGARIVVSSTWRLVFALDEIRRMLATKGLRAPVIDRTPEVPAEGPEGRVRALEIMSWLEARADRARRGADERVESFVILDDLEEFGPIERFCVRTRSAEGLLDEHVARAQLFLQSVERNPLTSPRGAPSSE